MEFTWPPMGNWDETQELRSRAQVLSPLLSRVMLPICSLSQGLNIILTRSTLSKNEKIEPLLSK